MKSFLFYLGLLSWLMACQTQPQEGEEVDTETDIPAEPAESPLRFEADLEGLNPSLYEDTIQGQAVFMMEGDSLTMQVTVSGVPAGMMHLQHLHSFEDGSAADCPPAEADQNEDGIIDLIETRDYAGVTMVPLHDDPVGLEIQTDTYPTAGEDGTYSYRKTVAISALDSAVQEKFNMDNPQLEDFVVFVHGVPEGNVPETAQSLPEVPAHVTVPIACGNVEPVE